MQDQDEHDALGALRIPAFRAFGLSRGTSAAAMTMLQAIISWQVYALTHSELQLGLIGLVRFAPALAASFIGGAVADSYNRRTVVQLAQCVPLLASLVVLGAIGAGNVPLLLIYSVVLATGLASSFETRRGRRCCRRSSRPRCSRTRSP